MLCRGHFSCVHTCSLLRQSWNGWGGVWGMITFLFLAQTLDATPRPLLLRVHTCSLLRQSWNGWGGVWGMITFLFLAQTLDATPRPLLLRVHTCSMSVLEWVGWGVGDDNVPFSCTHVGCYAAATSLACAHMLCELALALASIPRAWSKFFCQVFLEAENGIYNMILVHVSFYENLKMCKALDGLEVCEHAREVAVA